MYELTVQRTFSAAHYLRDYHGPCARLHGHNYRVEITVAGEKLQENGMLMDFGLLKSLCDDVLSRLDHQCLNELPEFAQQNVTAENLAALIYQWMAERLSSSAVYVTRVRLWENDTSSVTYIPD